MKTKLIICGVLVFISTVVLLSQSLRLPGSGGCRGQEATRYDYAPILTGSCYFWNNYYGGWEYVGETYDCYHLENWTCQKVYCNETVPDCKFVPLE